MEKVEQQKQWLIEVYPELMAVAMRLTQNVIKAEDAVSDAVVSALCQIQAYKCKATEMAQFCAWLRTIVRNRCKTRLKRGSYDLPTSLTAIARTSMPATQTQPVTVDTTTAKALTAGATWGTNSASNTLTCEGFHVHLLN